MDMGTVLHRSMDMVWVNSLCPLVKSMRFVRYHLQTYTTKKQYIYTMLYIYSVCIYIYIYIFNEPTKTSGAKQKSKALSNSAVVAADPLQCLKRKVEWPETLQCQFYPCHCTHHLAHTTIMVLYQYKY